MTSVPHTHPLPSLATQSSPTDRPLPGLRLRLTPEASPTGYVDGGWWPHSRDLTVELPGLVHELGSRLGVVAKVTFAPDAWQTAPRQFTVAEDTVRLAGFRAQDQYVVQVSGSDGRHLSLLVIPPEAPSTAAHRAMMTASRYGNAERPVEILATDDIVPDAMVPRLRLVSDDLGSGWAVDDGGL